MIKEYQITLFCTNGKYKPVSCIIKKDIQNAEGVDVRALKTALCTEGVQKICMKRGWTQRELTQYEYTKIKIREYNKEKIDKENAEKYKRNEKT